MRILVLPDIHGRKFWKVAINEIDHCDKVVFLGDYLDPYDFEHISVAEAIANFREIIAFAKAHQDKTVLLLGNHDMPYFSTTYLGLADWHCRYCEEYHDEIEAIFEENRPLFKVAHAEDGILFTHAGCTSGWLDHVFEQHNNSNHSKHIIANVKQVFGHTLQAYYGAQGDIVSGKAQEYYCCKMLDNRMAYILDTEKYKIKKINNDCK